MPGFGSCFKGLHVGMQFEVQHLTKKQTHQHLRYLLVGWRVCSLANSHLNICYRAAALEIYLKRQLYLSFTDDQQQWSSSDLGTLQVLERKHKGKKLTPLEYVLNGSNQVVATLLSRATKRQLAQVTSWPSTSYIQHTLFSTPFLEKM